MISYITGVKEIDLKDFEAWSGGKQRLNRIKDLPNCIATVEGLLNEFEINTGRPMTEGEINDYLWFDLENDLECEGLYNPETDKYYNEPYEWIED